MEKRRSRIPLLLFISILALALCPAFAFADEDNGETGDLANSWRYNNGELISSEQGARPDDDGVSTLSAEKNDQGYTVFNWFDHFSHGYCSGDSAKKVIDVSYHDGTIDWAKVKAAGIDYAIIRCGYGQDQRDQDDTQWLNNVRGCQENGIPFGVSLYSYATSTSRAPGEGQHALTCLKRAGLSPNDVALPVYYDLEENSLRDKDQAAFAKAFFAPLENAGYTTGTYASQSWWDEYLTDSCFDQRAKWVAAYNASRGLTYSGFSDFENSNGMWQFSDYGNVPGISTRCDLDYTYMSASKDQWIQSGNRWWYRHANGSYTIDDWEYINGSWYHFDSSGWMQTGWLEADGTWYYLNSSGAMATGWKQIGSTWYYLDGSGVMQTGWYNVSNAWHYSNDSGAMQTGWLSLDGTWYYLDSNGAMVCSSWVGDYYLLDDGHMATNQWIGPYYVGADGKWQR